MTGWAYTPEDAAKDGAFGLTGATLLVCGFIGQWLPDVGVKMHGSHYATYAATAIAFTSAWVYAYVAYGISFIVLFKRRMRRAKADHPDMTPVEQWSPRLPRFWNFSLTRAKPSAT